MFHVRHLLSSSGGDFVGNLGYNSIFIVNCLFLGLNKSFLVLREAFYSAFN